MTSKKQTTIALIIIFVVTTIGVLGYYIVKAQKKTPASSFEECAAQGNPILDSFPEQCRTPEGKTFTKRIAGENITVTGEYTCLPHANTDGPQTLECALGIKSENGEYFGLDDPEMKYITKLATGKKITVTGMFRKNAENNKYANTGTIEIQTLVEE
jgi:hypothetical protein